MNDPRNERWRPTGGSIGPAGVDGEYVPTERATAQRLLDFLADRRVLYAPYEMEDPNHCVQSVLQIRQFLTDLLVDWPQTTALRQHVTTLRGACREFLDAVTTRQPASLWRPTESHAPYAPASAGVWLDSLGRFRTHFGYHVAALMEAYDLIVEDQLGVILPPTPGDDVGEEEDDWSIDGSQIGPFFGRLWDR